MDKITLEEYKNYLVNKYVYEYDNNEKKRQKRLSILNRNYNDEYLEKIIIGTYNFVNKIIEIYENNPHEYIEIPLEREPKITYIDLFLMGGWKSDTIVSDSENNFYSIYILKEIFGEFFYIEPCKIEIEEELYEDDEFSILSEIPSYYLYIQLKKENIENAKTKVLRITNNKK